MKKSARGAPSRLALLTALEALMIQPSPAVKPGPMYGALEEERSYPEATYSAPAGKCVGDGCTGAYTCYGRRTDFPTMHTRGIVYSGPC